MERQLQEGVPMERSAQESVLVVVEGDAACPLWLGHWGPAPTDDWSMLEQEEGEAAPSFSDRVTATLSRCAADPSASDVILFVVGSRSDEAALAARWDLATTVLTHLSQRGGGRLLFTRGYGHDGRAEPALSVFAAELREEWDWAGIEIGTRLREPARAPQVRRASSAPYVAYRNDAQPVLHAV